MNRLDWKVTKQAEGRTLEITRRDGWTVIRVDRCNETGRRYARPWFAQAAGAKLPRGFSTMFSACDAVEKLVPLRPAVSP